MEENKREQMGGATVQDKAKRVHDQNVKTKEALLEREKRRIRDKKHLMLLILVPLGLILFLNFLLPMMLGFHQSGFRFVQRVIARKSLGKALGSTGENHILADGEEWTKALTQRLQQMGMDVRFVRRESLDSTETSLFGDSHTEQREVYAVNGVWDALTVRGDRIGGDLLEARIYMRDSQEAAAIMWEGLVLLGNMHGLDLEGWENTYPAGLWGDVRVAPPSANDERAYILYGCEDTSIMAERED